MGRFRRKAEERVVARRRIDRLFALAHRRMLEGEEVLADRSVRLGRRIAMRYQTGLTPGQRDSVCRACNGYLAPGRSARIRVEGGMKRTTCLRCGAVYRRPYRREQKARRTTRQADRAADRNGAGRNSPPGAPRSEDPAAGDRPRTEGAYRP